jgi:hypothetical protein
MKRQIGIFSFLVTFTVCLPMFKRTNQRVIRTDIKNVRFIQCFDQEHVMTTQNDKCRITSLSKEQKEPTTINQQYGMVYFGAPIQYIHEGKDVKKNVVHGSNGLAIYDTPTGRLESLHVIDGRMRDYAYNHGQSELFLLDPSGNSIVIHNFITTSITRNEYGTIEYELYKIAVHPQKPIMCTLEKENKLCLRRMSDWKSLFCIFLPKKLCAAHTSMKLSPNGEYAAISLKTKIIIVNFEKKNHFVLHHVHDLDIRDMAFHPVDPVITTLCYVRPRSAKIRHWSLVSKLCLAENKDEAKGLHRKFTRFCFSPENELVIAGKNQLMVLPDPLKIFERMSYWVFALHELQKKRLLLPDLVPYCVRLLALIMKCYKKA